MTKLQLLNAFFAERLMAAMQEIMQVVEGTLMEYQEENDRTKKENEVLRRKLRGAGLDSETANAVSKSPQSAPPLSADRTVSEQQEWSSRGQDPDPPLTAVKLEVTEPQRTRREEEEDHRQEEELHCAPESGADGSVIPSPCSKRECDPTQAAFPSPRGKRDSRPGSRNHPDLKLQIGNTEEKEPVPDVAQRQVKTESDRVDCDLSDRPVEPAPGESYGAGGNGDGSGVPASERHSEENPAALPGDASLSCVYCGKVFFLLSRLKSHLRTHTEYSSYRCDVCGKCFSQSGNLNVHQRIHTGKKPYSCNICGKSFNYSGKFKEHQRIHTGERPYRCHFCGKFFSQSGHLKAHVRIHTGEKPYRCPVCGSCFAQLSQIKRHLLIHTQEISIGSINLGELC